MDEIGAEKVVAKDVLFFVKGDIVQQIRKSKGEVAEEAVKKDKLESSNKNTPEQELLQAAQTLVNMAKTALKDNKKLFDKVENETRLKLKNGEYSELKIEGQESMDSIEIKALLKEITRKKYYSLLSGLLYNKKNKSKTNFFNEDFVKAAEKFKQKLDVFLGRKTLLTIVDKDSGELKILNGVEEEKLLTLSKIVTDKHRLKIPSVSEISFTSPFDNEEEEKQNELKKLSGLMNEHSQIIKETYQNTRKRITRPKESLPKDESPTGKPIEWKNARNKWIVWIYKDQKEYLQFRTIQNEGAVAEGYVAALFDKEENHNYYYIKDNVTTTNQKEWNKEEKELNIGILYSYIKQINNMAGILQEDVKISTEEGEDIFLAVKTQNASTGSYTPFFAVAEAVIFMFEGQNQSESLINSNSMQDAKIIENKKQALQKVIQDISTEKIKINNVFTARELIKDIGEVLPEEG